MYRDHTASFWARSQAIQRLPGWFATPSERLYSRRKRSSTLLNASLAFFRSDLPNRTPLTSQLDPDCAIGLSRSTITPINCLHSGADFFTASVMADSSVARE